MRDLVRVSLAHRGSTVSRWIAGVSPPGAWTRCDNRWKPVEPRVSRASAHITYPARIQLVAAMNPCRCGYLGDAERECKALRAPW